jgi:putative oxidoreductase
MNETKVRVCGDVNEACIKPALAVRNIFGHVNNRAAISGANKLFVAGGTKPVYETFVEAKVPFPQQVAYFVSGVEFVGGSLLTVGFLSSPACVALLIDMIVAVLSNTLSTMPKGLSPLSWLDDFLYLPEVLYVLFFIWLICSDPGKFSVDY